MTTVDSSTYIGETPRNVFDAFTNLNEAAGAINDITGFERLTPGRTERGTRFRETRKFFGQTMTEEMEIVDFQPNADVPTYTVRGDSCGTRFDTVYQFHPEGEGTRVVATMNIVPQTFLARVLSPIGRLVTGRMRKCLERDLADLKRVIERGTLVGADAKRAKRSERAKAEQSFSYATRH